MTAVNPSDVATADLMGRLLKQASRAVAAEGMRASHFRLLSEVPPAGASITELAERLGMTKQACGQFVVHLSATGHVRVEVPADDRRTRRVLRTPRGDAAAADFARRMAEVEGAWSTRGGPRRYAALREVLQDLLR